MILLIRVLLLLKRGRRNFQRYGLLLSVLCVTITGWLIAWQSGFHVFFALPSIILMGVMCYLMSYFPAFAVPLLVQRRTRLQAVNVLS